MLKKILIQAWAVDKKNDRYYLPFTHWIYLKEIVNYYDEVILLAPCKYLKSIDEVFSIDISSFDNVSVYELPMSSGSYISSLKYFFSYVKAYHSIQKINTYYARYPTPFGWLQKVFSKNKKRIIHYVGNPKDAAINNPNFSFFKKIILLSGFSLENALYTWACKGAEVYTNGHHLSENLYKKGVVATPLISSTLTSGDFYYADKKINPETISFIYLGYLRTAKGVETIIQAFKLYSSKYPNSSLSIIGSGELESKLKKIVKDSLIKNVHFLGRVEDRALINKELRAADIFLFSSLSEGSPRVVLEAMANGLAVISTPVGSLPSIFKNQKDIIFSAFNNPKDFFEKMEFLANNEVNYNNLRAESYKKAKELTLDNFIYKIFHE